MGNNNNLGHANRGTPPRGGSKNSPTGNFSPNGKSPGKMIGGNTGNLSGNEVTTVHIIPGELSWRGVPKGQTSANPGLNWGEYNYHGHEFNYQFNVVSYSPAFEFTTDLDICYQAFAKDFGPLNLAVIWRYQWTN